MVVHKDNYEKLNNDKVRIGYLGNGTILDENICLIRDGLYYNKNFGVNCEIKS